MSCRFLEPGRPWRCALVRGDVVPSLFERERHCYTGETSTCRVCRAAVARGEALDEDEYYALWLPPEEHPVPAA